MTELIDTPVEETAYYAPDWAGEALPAPLPPTTLHGELEPAWPIRAIVTVRMGLSRDTLAALIEHAAVEVVGIEDLDAWPVEDIRASVQHLLAVDGQFEYEKASEHMAAERRGEGDGSLTDHIAQVYRTVDRAYPETAPVATAVGGTPHRSQFACQACGWTGGGDSLETAGGSVLDHVQREHGGRA
ncbi:hypothetical protein [Streptomyces sp. 5-6(2022)]|uniref:hypothetical protein n=1 Tax=Streptomyces sp. 5-6(2022) TaxID=2936510 RepID=UPI0023B9FD8D|nr:hypothetical protein [Streptomyces sp. 5-6(2022)]